MAHAHRIKTCLIAICALCSNIGAQGKMLYDTVRTVQEVTVRAERHSQTGEVSASKSMGGSEMKAAQTLQVSDALKYMSGATVKDYGGVGGLKTVSVRGLGAQHTAVMYNGLIVTDNQTGQIDLGKFSASQAEMLSMTSGPQNDLLQPATAAAQAAVINIEGARPDYADSKPAIKASLKYGSFNTWAAEADGGCKIGSSSVLSMQAEWLSTQGDYPYIQENSQMSKQMYRENSQVQRLRAEAGLSSEIGEYGELSVRAYWFSSEQGLPANILYNEGAARERLWNKNGFVQSWLTLPVGERLTIKIRAKYGHTYTRYLNPWVNSTEGRSDNRYHESEAYLSGVALYRFTERISGAWAIDGRMAELTGSGADHAHPTRYTLHNSAALKYAHERVTVTARLNHVVTHETTAIREAAEDYNHLSPVAGINWYVWQAAGLHLRASYSHTYRLPTFNDLYFEQVGRRDLRPEQAVMQSIGVIMEQKIGCMGVQFYIDGYNSQVKDRIMAVPGKNTAVWMMKNIGQVTTHGLESGMEVTSQQGVIRPSLKVSYTYQRCMDKSDRRSPTWNHQLPYTPRHAASGIAWVETPYINIACNLIYSGEYFSNGYNGPEYSMPSYYEVGCSAWHTLQIRRSRGRGVLPMDIKAECINLTDSRYELVRNYPMPGRQFRVTLGLAL